MASGESELLMKGDEDLFGDGTTVKYNGFVYVIHSPGMRRIKVGMAWRHPLKRISKLRTGSPDILYLCGILKVDDISMEKYIHSFLKEHNSHGEWFEWPACQTNLTEAIRLWPGPVAINRTSGPIGRIIEQAIAGRPIANPI